MTSIWLRRGLLLAAASAVTLLAGCGAGTVYSSLVPSRFIAFGDGFSDVGQGGTKYSVNDGNISGWAQELANVYGKPLTPKSAGGLGYAVGNARIVQKPDAAGNAATPTLKEQIDAFLATNSFAADDVVTVNGGVSDMLVQGQALIAGTLSAADFNTNVKQAGLDLGTQVRRLVAAGAQHVVVTGVYNMSKSPWGVASGQAAVLSAGSISFNTALLTSVVDLGANVLYVDSAYYVNLMVNLPAAYGLTNSTVAACTSVDAGPGIGIGANQVNSSLCTATTVTAGIDYSTYAFADNVYLAPTAGRAFGDYAAGRTKSRW